MKRPKKIQDNDLGYLLLQRYALFLFRLAYRRFEVHKDYPVPQEGTLIYAPNHTNALMDALAVLSIDKQRKVFVARADIFKKPALAKLFTFLKIMPIHRIRDGRASVRGNDKVIQQAVDVLRDHVPFCILPEGTHRAMHSLLPLSKGIFRIALIASNEFGHQRPVYIVPVGLEYGNFFRYRSSLLLQLGEPINVTEFVAQHPELTEPEIMNLLKERLFEAIKDLILYIPDDEHYDASYELCNIMCNAKIKQLGLFFRSLKDRLTANKDTLAQLSRLRATQPEAATSLLIKCNQFGILRKERGISMASVVNRTPVPSFISRLVYIVCLFPLFVVCAVLFAPVEGLMRYICGKMEDAAFHNSARFLTLLVFWTLLSLIYITLLFCLVPWPIALPLAVACPAAPWLYWEYRRWFRIAVSDRRWLRSKDLHHLKNEIVKGFSQK